MLASKVHFGVVSSRNHGIEVSTLETIPKSSSFLYTQSGDKKTLPSDQSRYTGIRSSWIKIYNASPSSAAQQHQNGSRSRHLRSMFQIIPSPREWTGAALGLPKILCLSRRVCLKKLLYSQREDNPTWLSVSVCNAHKAIKELESARHCENATFQLPCYLFRNSTSKACDGKSPAIFMNIPKQFWSDTVSISIGSHSARENAGFVRSIGHCRIGLCQPNYIQLVKVALISSALGTATGRVFQQRNRPLLNRSHVTHSPEEYRKSQMTYHIPGTWIQILRQKWWNRLLCKRDIIFF